MRDFHYFLFFGLLKLEERSTLTFLFVINFPLEVVSALKDAMLEDESKEI